MPVPRRVALVTGSSRGIGAAIASKLAAQGFVLVLSGRSTTALQQVQAEVSRAHPGATPQIVPGDLAQAEVIEQLVRTIEELGTIEVLVNNAGTAPSDKIERTDDATLDEVLSLHVRTPFRLIRALLPKMVVARNGVILQIASTAGLRGFPFTSAYGAAKHAMVGLTRALHAELQNTGVRVYAVCPGFVDTDITRNAAKAIAARGRIDADEALRRMGAMNRIGRMHRVEEVANAVAELVQDRPSSCVLDLDRDPPMFLD